MNTLINTFPVSDERKHLPPFVVFKHIKLSNLISQKATNNEQLFKSRMSDHHWQYIYT